MLAPSATEVLGVNDSCSLPEVEACYRSERARELMLAGATLADPARIDVARRGLTSGATYSSM